MSAQPGAASPLSADAAAAEAGRELIAFFACSGGETLPSSPEFPADLFTACLTTPLRVALRWFAFRQRGAEGAGEVSRAADNVPGRASDRSTPLGELSWIFTTVTDTLAWNVLPVRVFQQLFRQARTPLSPPPRFVWSLTRLIVCARQDFLLAALSRNFFLAQRVFGDLGRTPLMNPPMPDVRRHPLWAVRWPLRVSSLPYPPPH